MTALYNEIDPYAAQWLRNAIEAGVIAPGVVDERSIEDLEPDYVRQFTQFHAFAGIGIWSLALRGVGWPDDRPVWTGSCPCQPFSEAGKGLGFADERHLFPAWNHLIGQCRPPVVLGEQSAAKRADAWIDLVQADLEGLGYAFGAVAFPSAGVGAPHIRDRTYFAGVAQCDAASAQPQGFPDGRRPVHGPEGSAAERTGGDAPGRLADADRAGCGERGRPGLSGTGQSGAFAPQWWTDLAGRDERDGPDAGGRQGTGHAQGRGGDSGLADAYGGDACAEREQRGGQHGQFAPDGGALRLADARGVGRGAGLCDSGPTGQRRHLGSDRGGVDGLERPARGVGHAASGGCGEFRDATQPGRSGHDDGGGELDGPPTPGPVNGFWRAADWLFCRDGKWRPVKSGSFPLVNGAPARTGRLRAYGNAINKEAAQEFIRGVQEYLT